MGIIAAVSCLLLCQVMPSHAGDDAVLYSRALKAARSRDYEFAFMNYRRLLRDHPCSRYTERALFANGEYFSFSGSALEAQEIFSSFVKAYPDSPATLFALAHLYKMALKKGREEDAQQFKNEIISLKQVSLVFRDFKEYTYLSPLNRAYRAVFQIDTIDFYVEDELFTQISY